MKVLVTGCAGFIGYHLSSYLLKKKFHVIGFDNLNPYYSIKLKNQRLKILKKFKNFEFHKLDISNKKKLSNLFKLHRLDIIYHLSAQPGIMYSYKNPRSYKQNNILATKNLIELVKRNDNIKKFIFASSSSVYGKQNKYPISEKFDLHPQNYYGKTKKICEDIIIKNLSNNKVKKYIIYRFFTVYGSFGRPDMFITGFRYRKKNSILNLYNYGNYERDFTYIDDIVKVLSKSIKNSDANNKIINICSGNPIRVKNLANLLEKKFKKNTKIILKPPRKGEMIKTHGDSAKLKKIFNIKKFTNIKSGINKFYNLEKKFLKK